MVLLNARRDYAEWLLPLAIVCLFAFLVAHCFLSVFEMVVDVLFLCFAIDTKYNDGTPGKEFFMDKALMVSVLDPTRNSVTFFSPPMTIDLPPLPISVVFAHPQELVERSRRTERAAGRGRGRVKEAPSEEGAEMKPMVSAGGAPAGGAVEWEELEELEEFQVYYLLVAVFLDCTLTPHADFLLCLSHDVFLFLCVYLPTSTLFLFGRLLGAAASSAPPAPCGSAH